MKSYQEFITEAKKCWPGYKKKGTQKLFGKTYNRCVKEGKVPWNDPKNPLESGHTPAEKNREKRKRTGVEDSSKSPTDKDYARYGVMKSVDDEQSNASNKKNKSTHKFRDFPISTDKGKPQTIGQLRRTRGTPKPGVSDEKSNLYQSPIRKDDKRTRGGRLDQWKGPNPRNEEIEYELEESSTGERSGRRTRGSLTLARGRGADMDRRERTTAAVAKKAGLKGTGKYSTKDLNTRARDYTTYDSEDTKDDAGSTKQDHDIRTYSSARRAAEGENLVSKLKPSGRRTPAGMTRLKTAPSSESVRRVNDLKRQMTKAGASKTGKVHIVDIMPRDSKVRKGDKSQQIKRGRNFFQAIRDTPEHLKRAGAKKGDTVLGKPTAVMPGEDKKTGEAKRAKLYGKIFGKKLSKASPTTGLMTGTVG